MSLTAAFDVAAFERFDHSRLAATAYDFSPLKTRLRGEPILIFYDGLELKALPGLMGALSHGRGVARYAYRSLRGKQVRTGFYTAYIALVASLRRCGFDVRINDFDYALRHPSAPIGLTGYASVLNRADSLPNPRIFGPGDFGFPPETAAVAADPRFKTLTHPSQWYVELYRRYCGSKLKPWFVGIDLQKYRVDDGGERPIDYIVYDKIRWDRDGYEKTLIPRVLKALDAKGRRYVVLRYGEHRQAKYLSYLRQARGLIFLCEHETQGLAYQEALAMGVPVLAWDEQRLVDPRLLEFVTQETHVSSVPYFDDRCGRRFNLETFEKEFARFDQDLPAYRPRAYVAEHLSQEECAYRYVKFYLDAKEA